MYKKILTYIKERTKSAVSLILLLAIFFSNIHVHKAKALDVDCFWDIKFESNWGVSTPPDSTYFDPKITVMHELCMFFCCGKEYKTLKWHGECGIFWGTGFIRVCARPYKTTYKKLANGENNTNEPIRDGDPPPGDHADGKYNNWIHMHVCAFDDPSSPFDLNDWDVTVMPYPHNTPNPDSGTYGTSILLGGAGVIAAIANPAVGATLAIAAGATAAINAIKSTINYTVTDNRGCVKVPNAPNPPPFTPKVPIRPPTVKLVNICKKEGTSIQTSNMYHICEGEKDGETIKYSTFSHPRARVAIENKIDKCTTTQLASLSQDTDESKAEIECAEIKKESLWIGSESSLMPKCSAKCNESATIEPVEPCVCFHNIANDTKIAGPFRVLYGLNKNNIPENTFNEATNQSEAIKDSSWLITSYPYSLYISAIEYSNYGDLTVRFNKGEDENDTSYSNSNVNLDFWYSFQNSDNSKDNYKLVAENSKYSNNVLCVQDDKEETYGCFDRPSMPKPVVAETIKKVCEKNNGINCIDIPFESTHSKPALALGVGDSDFQIDNVRYSQDAKKYLNGIPFSVTVIDKDNTPLEEGTYLIGKYRKKGSFAEITEAAELIKIKEKFKNNTINSDNSDYIYKDGIEYKDGRYIRGGEYVCLQGYVSDQRVLSKIVTKTYPSTQSNDNSSLPPIEQKVTSDFLPDRIFPPYTTNQTYIPESYVEEKQFLQNGKVVKINGSLIHPEINSPETAKYKIIQGAEALRTKLHIEDDLCIKVPRPICPEITDNAGHWPETIQSGAIIEGDACSASTTTPRPKRICQLKANNFDEAEWSEAIDGCTPAIRHWWPDYLPNYMEGIISREQWKKAYDYNYDLSKLVLNNIEISIPTDSLPRAKLLVYRTNNNLTVKYLQYGESSSPFGGGNYEPVYYFEVPDGFFQ